ncbi:MAG: bacterial transcriptional activator domain-containing protein [Nocardioides sp.]
MRDAVARRRPREDGTPAVGAASTLRSALDPGKQWSPDHVIEGDNQGLRLSARHVSVDLHDFLADAEEAGRAAEEGREAEARALLSDLLAEHAGEAFEDDPYETWASEVRDHVRAVRVQSLRTAARLAGRAGDIDDAVVHLVRLLAVDPYDEPAHQLLVTVLVRARRHGEARRAFDRWTRANLEIGAQPPDPARFFSGSDASSDSSVRL